MQNLRFIILTGYDSAGDFRVSVCLHNEQLKRVSLYKIKISIFISQRCLAILEINFILKLAHTYKSDVCLSYKEKKGLTGMFVHVPGHEHTSSSLIVQSC